MSKVYAMILTPIRGGWAVSLTDGRRLATFHGPLARCRAIRYLAHMTGTHSGFHGIGSRA